MIEYGFSLIALFAVMIIPGPTNALLASSAQQIGMQKSLRLIPAELIGYIYAMALWWLIVAFTDDIWPLFIDILHFASAIYVFWLAFRLWKMKHLHAYSQRFKNIKAMQLFYSTFKNPKAALFSVGIFPHETWSNVESYAISMLLFSAVLIPSALFWMFYGSRLLTGRFKGINQEQLYRSSALLLLVCMLPIIVRFFN